MTVRAPRRTSSSTPRSRSRSAPSPPRVTLNVIDQLTSNCIVEISPANTASDLSGYSSYYYRTAPPDSVQGSALGQLVTGDGNAKVAFLVFNDTYGTGLRNSVQAAVEASGGQVVYGGKGKGQEFPPGRPRSRPR